MRIAISATEPSLDAPMGARFGRSPWFVITDREGTIYDLVPNSDRDLESGAGIQAARLLVQRRILVVLTGRCGPNASVTLAAAGIAVVTGCSGTVRQVLKKFTKGLNRPAAGEFGSQKPAVRKTVDRTQHPAASARMGRNLGRRKGRGMGGGFGSSAANEWHLGNLPGI